MGFERLIHVCRPQSFCPSYAGAIYIVHRCRHKIPIPSEILHCSRIPESQVPAQSNVSEISYCTLARGVASLRSFNPLHRCSTYRCRLPGPPRSYSIYISLSLILSVPHLCHIHPASLLNVTCNPAATLLPPSHRSAFETNVRPRTRSSFRRIVCHHPHAFLQHPIPAPGLSRQTVQLHDASIAPRARAGR